MIGQERLIVRQIPMLGGTEIKPNIANMEKGLTYRYILPWTNLGMLTIDHWAPD